MSWLPVVSHGRRLAPVRLTDERSALLNDRDVLAAAKALPGVAKYLEGMTLVKEVVVPGRLVGLVVK